MAKKFWCDSRRSRLYWRRLSYGRTSVPSRARATVVFRQSAAKMFMCNSHTKEVLGTSASAWLGKPNLLFPGITRVHWREEQECLIRNVCRLRGGHRSCMIISDVQHRPNGDMPSGKLNGVCFRGSSGLAHVVKESRQRMLWKALRSIWVL